jgi:hypothetical protein
MCDVESNSMDSVLDILGSFVGIWKDNIKWIEFGEPVLYWRPIGSLPGDTE